MRHCEKKVTLESPFVFVISVFFGVSGSRFTYVGVVNANGERPCLSIMSALFLIPICATSFGGALALGALFHYCNGGTKSSREADSLDSRERLFEARCAEVIAELDAKRAALEALTSRATEAAASLDRILDSFSTTFADAPSQSENRGRRENKSEVGRDRF
ncbi:MAG: hypothetical protein HUK22_03170 [Thermoguttaceae bacterium]|nr:hypothetical protein [Thermoguttaceae bacterium]